MITEQHFFDAAKRLRCSVPAVKAVTEVESSGSGFLSDGRVKVLFEGHVFYKYTKGKYATSHPSLCYPKWTRVYYARGANAYERGAKELARLEQAKDLNRTAALLSASYGMFQIMGFNFAHCDFPTVDLFADAMKKDESEQLNAFCSYIIDVGLDDELRQGRWADFARKYNGPAYQKNRYDQKLKDAYNRYYRQEVPPRH